MKKLKSLFTIGFIFVMIFSLAACNSSGDKAANTQPASGGSGGGSDTAGTVNIGFTGPLSGPAAFYGKRTLNGIQMAADDINNAGGFEVGGKKYKLNIVSLDDKYLPNEAGANAKRLVQENKTPIIFVPHSGGVFALQVFNQQSKFIIGAYTSEPKITQTGNKLTVRIPPAYDGYLQPFTDYEMNKFGKRIAFLPTNSQYGKDWSSKLKPFWEKQGGKVVFNSSIDFTKDTDFFTIVTNALKTKPDVLFIGGASEPTAKVAKQARELGFKGGFIIMDQAKLDEMKTVTGTYDLLNGSIGVMPLVEDTSMQAVPDFEKKYKAKYGEDAGSEAGLNYIATYAFVEAMKAAGTVDDTQKIRDHMQDGLTNLPDSAKIYDIPKIDGNGGFVGNLEIASVEDGKIVPIKVSK
ncbi:ABC transporter substrate-binding protein [Bacillus sp. BRMEA1]|uniref:ABC transporter substrate-binding protein n=1 Tax=Neobacillus endophyticus TaxID=2738405 RepID=UPI00156674E1|nr:ABC transporter substrate-binding protein [Neobacillus endophyticus]NRD79353.1 ABC transporter substrate-binding protein [Neobacillus endophyticus]